MPRGAGVRCPGAARAVGSDRPQVRGRALAGDRAQRNGRPRRRGPDRPAAHLRGARADRSRLSLLRRAACARSSASWRPPSGARCASSSITLAASGTDSTHLGPSLLARALRSAAVATPPVARPARASVGSSWSPLEDDQVLVTLLMQSGGVRQVVQRSSTALEREELTRLSNELSEKLADKTAGQVRRAMKTLTESAAALRHRRCPPAAAGPGAGVRRRLARRAWLSC